MCIRSYSYKCLIIVNRTKNNYYNMQSMKICLLILPCNTDCPKCWQYVFEWITASPLAIKYIGELSKYIIKVCNFPNYVITSRLRNTSSLIKTNHFHNRLVAWRTDLRFDDCKSISDNILLQYIIYNYNGLTWYVSLFYFWETYS